MSCGIYIIQHLSSGRLYVGQSRDIAARWKQHRGGDSNRFLKRAVSKYGWEAFRFEVIEECPLEELNDREIFHITRLNSIAPHGFNLRGGGLQMSQISEETREAFRRANRKKASDPEWKRKHKEVARRLADDPEWRRKQREASRDPGVILQKSRTARKYHSDPEWRARWYEATWGPEARKKRSQS